MSKIFQIALGILAAIGGFVDIGDLVFNVEAGATLGYQLLWVVVVGVVGIIVYSEMCGRVAAVSKRPGVRRDPRAARLRSRLRSPRRVADREPDDPRGRGRWRRPRSRAPLGASLPRVDRARRGRACGRHLGHAVRVDRADLRLRRARPPRVRGRGDQAAPGLGRRGHRVRPARDVVRQARVRLLRGRTARSGHDPLRGVLLLVGRRRGGLDAEGPRAEQDERDHRLQPRRDVCRLR